MYKIIGADQKEYGPVSDDLIRQWIAEGRANARTQARLEGEQEWKPLLSFPEFAATLGGPPPSIPGAAATAAAISAEGFAARDYDLEIGRCIGDGWNLFKQNFGTLFCGVLIYFAIEFGFALFGAIPFIGWLFSIANMVIAGPLEGGVFFMFLLAIRNQPTSASDVFSGFRKAFAQLFLGRLIPALIIGACMVPVGIIIVLLVVIPMAASRQEPQPWILLLLIPLFLIVFIAVVFVATNWIFTLPLIIDKGMTFWPAMQVSWKMVRKHWWQVFGLVLLVAIINIGGLLLCGIGLLFTAPIGFAAMMYGYETIFGRKAA